MSILELFERIQSTGVSRTISESTWGYPIIGAFHVLAIALSGGAILIPHLRALGFAVPGRKISDPDREVRWIRRTGVALVVITGALLFASGAVGYYRSTAFRIKIVLLAILVLNAVASSRQSRSKLHSAISLALWTAVIFAARGIAFF
jgi:hypothetical protein